MLNRLKKTSGSVLFAAVSALLVLVSFSGAYAGTAPSTAPQTSFNNSTAAQAPLDSLKDALVSFFTPMCGNVLSVKDGVLTAAISNSSSPVVNGMRFRVLKKGAEFFHPVTGKPLWRTEEPTGAAEATKTLTGKSGSQVQLKIIEGQAAPGDVVRISASRVKLLFYQLKNVSWGLAQQYYDLLRKSNRFDLLSSPMDDEKDALAEGKRLKADAVLIVSQGTEGGSAILTQKLIWASESTPAMVSGAVIGQKNYKYLTLGDRLFTPKSSSLITFSVPFGARMISLADVLGKGNQILAIASSDDISFYNISNSLLAPALDGAEIKAKKTDRFLKVQAADVTGSGKDQIITAAKRGDDIVSAIYAYKGGSFHRLWEGPFFLRGIDGKLYAQKASMAQGFKGGVHQVRLEEGRLVWGGKLPLPAGVNIYDFSFMRYGGRIFTIAYDNQGAVSVYDNNGLAVWKSSSTFGGFPESFKKENYNPASDDGHWCIKDNIEVMGHDALLIDRQYLIKMVQGLGYKSSRINVLRWNGTGMQELALGDRIGGTIMDFAASKNRLMILASPVFGLNLAKILQGESPFITRLYMYPLEGE